MRAPLSVELRRMVLRRTVRAVAGAAIVGSVVAGLVVFSLSHKSDARTLERESADRIAAIERCARGGFNAPLDSLPAATRADVCAEALPVPPFTFRLTQLLDVLEGVGLKGTSLPLVVLAGLLGASFVGAEWPSGSMATLLAWEPRRVRVAIAKIAASAIVVFLGALLLQAVFGIALVPAAALRGTTAGADGRWLSDAAGAVTRVSAVAAVAAAIGGSVALIGRSTAAALGAASIYALMEVVVRSFENPSWQRWLLGDVAGALILGRASSGRSVLAAGVLLTAFTTALVFLSVWMFRSRDVS